MKRIQEKVKDLVEVHVYRSLQDFSSDPAQTLEAYHFTDATSEMMAKWIDSVAYLQVQSGVSKALAGYRGVGKSHFFATFAAIVSCPELRTKITDSHVASSAQQLKRRRYPVAFVRRGTHETLVEEIREAIAGVYEVNPSTLPAELSDLAALAAEKAGDLPFLLMVDTAFERIARVARDDGALLGELAEITRNLNFFVAVALDDDIAGADGVNAGIARNYAIDYLDQEHLYRVVETNIFPKNRLTRNVLHDIHENFREVLPGFRWSEQRFVSLYPVHPVILELAQFIRLYAPDFAFLSFASEAGNKVLGRPANSLVGLDEVFDKVENSLRKSEELTETFTAFDYLNSAVIANIPVMQRLQAKLVLKAFLLLSLDGDGTTADEVSAAMLIYDETDLQKSKKEIEELLDTFSSALPEQVRRKTEDGRETRYSFKVSGKDDLNEALSESASAVPDSALEGVLRRLARERFPDWTLQSEEEQPVDTAECQIVWRGGCRRGRMVWNWQAENPSLNAENLAEFVDWEVMIGNPLTELRVLPEKSFIPTVIWCPATPRADELDTLRNYYVLLTDKNLREVFGEQFRAAGHAYHREVKRIWSRIFLEDGKFLFDGEEHSFDDKGLTAPTLEDLLAQILTPVFEARYPKHPVFARTLGLNEVATLVSAHFSGAKPTLSEIQELAQTFALPLGLVIEHGNNFILNSDEKRLAQPFVREVMALVAESGEETVSLKEIYRELKKEPFGLVHEAVHLVLAALVAQRHLEFVTSKGDRINRRSLDLQIIWDDIVGVAAPSTVLYSSAKLTEWARIVTEAKFTTVDDPDEREKIKQSLENRLADWRSTGILERFEKLPPEILTTKIWRLARHAQKTFGVMATTIESILDESISLEEGLQRIADAFSDSEQEFYSSKNDLAMLEDFINGANLREKVWKYMAICETTQDAQIEELRENIFRIIREMTNNPNEAYNRELDDLWQEFQTKFSEHFAIKHYSVMKSHHLQEKFDEILQSDEWWEFENLSELSVFQKTHWNQAQKICRRLRELNCAYEVQELLKTYPFCACSFRLSKIGEWERLPKLLEECVAAGRDRYRKTLAILGETLLPVFQQFAQTETSPEFVEAARRLAEIIGDAGQMPLLKNAELVILKKALQAMPSSPLLQISVPSESGFLTREELRLQLSQWLDELPNEPILLKI
jgi:hypothetical protein